MYVPLGYLSCDEGRHEEAEALFTCAIRITMPPAAFYGRGLARLELQNKALADEDFRGFISAAPDSPWAEKARSLMGCGKSK